MWITVAAYAAAAALALAALEPGPEAITTVSHEEACIGLVRCS